MIAYIAACCVPSWPCLLLLQSPDGTVQASESTTCLLVLPGGLPVCPMPGRTQLGVLAIARDALAGSKEGSMACKERGWSVSWGPLFPPSSARESIPLASWAPYELASWLAQALPFQVLLLPRLSQEPEQESRASRYFAMRLRGGREVLPVSGWVLPASEAHCADFSSCGRPQDARGLGWCGGAGSLGGIATLPFLISW